MLDITTMLGLVSTLAAVLAVAGAFYAGLQAAKVRTIESNRDALSAEELLRRDESQRRLQASRISAWYLDRAPTLGPELRGVYAFNGSESPVYNVNLTLFDVMRGSRATASIPVLAPTREGNLVWQPELPPRSEDASVGVQIQVTFTDAEGIRWQRNRHGQLKQLPNHLEVACGVEMSAALTACAEDFRLGYGVTLDFRSDILNSGLRRLLAQGAHSEVAIGGPSQKLELLPVELLPDAIVGPNDWLGEFVASGAIAEIMGPPKRGSDELLARAASSFWSRGRQYGIPISVDTMALVRNTSLAPDEPESIEEMLRTGLRLRDSGEATQALCVGVGATGDPFQIWPIFSGRGGWLFGRDHNGDWDPSEIGIASPDSIDGFRMLRDLGDLGDRVLTTEIDQAQARDLFYAGKVPYLLDMYSGIRPRDPHGFPVAVSDIPAFANRRPGNRFYVVYGFFIGSRGNQQVASDFLPHYLDFGGVSDAIQMATNCPVLRPPYDLDATSQLANACREACRTALPLPSFPQMDAVWSALGTAEIEAIKGGDPFDVARRAEIAIRDALLGSAEA